MSSIQHDLERLLRWYPRRWRQEHGPALVGMYLDAEAESADGDGRLNATDAAAIRTAGLFERTRFALPIGAAILGTVVLAAGYALSLATSSLIGAVLWFGVGPVILCLSLWSLLAARAGGWTWRTVVSIVVSAEAVTSVGAVLWIAVLRDNVDGARPSLNSMWSLGLIYAILVGVTVAISASPSFVRYGMRGDWGLTLGFVIGLVGAVPIGLGLLTGVTAILAGGVLTWFTIRAARRSRRTLLGVPSAPVLSNE